MSREGSVQAGHEQPGPGPAHLPGAVSLPGPHGRSAANLHPSEGEHQAAERPGDEGRARLRGSAFTR